MAIDPDPTTPRAGHPSAIPRINDDLPAYRAISRLAVGSLIFGLAAILTFTSGWFGLLALGAIALGIAAQQRIKRFPDVLTGASMAQAGIAFGLMFSLTALTISGVQSWLLSRDAGQFARAYAETLKTGTLDDALYLQLSARNRKERTPKQAVDEMVASSQRPEQFDILAKPIRDLKARIASTPDQTITYLGLDDVTNDGVANYVLARFELKGSPSKEFPEATQIAQVKLQGVPDGGKIGWSVEEVRFPFKQP